MNKLDALKFFITAAETLNFREAAVKLAISPSVVTRTIAELENQLGEPLFKRNTRSITLTSFGELFLPKAKRLLADYEQMIAEAPDGMADADILVHAQSCETDVVAVQKGDYKQQDQKGNHAPGHTLDRLLFDVRDIGEWSSHVARPQFLLL